MALNRRGFLAGAGAISPAAIAPPAITPQARSAGGTVHPAAATTSGSVVPADLTTGGTITGDLVVTGNLTASGWQYPLLAPTGPRPAWRPSSWFQNFQAGHGWSGSGTGTVTPNDTSTFVRGTQCATLTTAGTGTSTLLSRTGQSALDLTGKALRLILKIDSVAAVKSINFYVGSNGLGNTFKWKAWNTTGSTSMIQSGEWVTVTLQWADVNAADGSYTLGSNGAPSTTSGFTDMQFELLDDGSGTVTGHLQSVEVIQDTTRTFPNGVVSVTFDDSWQSAYDLGRPIMDSHGFRGTSYTITDYIGTDSRLTLSELTSLQDLSGWEIAGHAYTSAMHAARYDTLTAAQVDQELRNLKAWLVVNEFHSDSFAYPGGHFGHTTDGVGVDQLVGRYFHTGRSINYLNTTEMFPAAMPKRLRALSSISSSISSGDPANVTKLTGTGGLLDRCQLQGSWLILTFHEIISGTSTDTTQCNVGDFQTVMAAIASRGIPVVPVGDVIRNYA